MIGIRPVLPWETETVPTLEIANVSVVYDVDDGPALTAVDDVSITVDTDQFITVIGPSGCGKSTLLHCMGGLFRPTAGEIRIDGKVMSGPDPTKAAFVFQEYSLLPWKTVLDNAAIGLQFAHVSRSERTARADEALSRVGLSDFMNSYPYQLSGGMQQRVAVARALTMDPEILLMDEPFGALDEQTRRALGFEMTAALTESRKTVIMVTHSLDEAIFWGDRVIVMSGRPGHILQEFQIKTPRPRSVDFLATDEFVELRSKLLALLAPTPSAEPESAPDSTIQVR